MYLCVFWNPETSFDVVCGCVCVSVLQVGSHKCQILYFVALVHSRNVIYYFACSFSLLKYNRTMCFLYFGGQRCPSTTCFPHNVISKLGDLSVRRLLIHRINNLRTLRSNQTNQDENCISGIKTKWKHQTTLHCWAAIYNARIVRLHFGIPEWSEIILWIRFLGFQM